MVAIAVKDRVLEVGGHPLGRDDERAFYSLVRDLLVAGIIAVLSDPNTRIRDWTRLNTEHLATT